MAGIEKFFELSYSNSNDVSESISPRVRRRGRRILGGGLVASYIPLIMTEGAQDYVTARQFNPESMSPFEYSMIYHTGDFGNGFVNTFVVATFFEMFFPRMSYKLKTGVASGLSFALLAVEELKSSFIGGISDPADIPAGIVGIGAFVGTSLWARRAIQKGSGRQFSQ